MGLDYVELVLAIEDHFRIEIPDADAGDLGMLGDMHNYIVHALWKRGEVPDEALVWEQLTDIVVEQLGVRREEVTRSTHVMDDLGAD